MFGTHGYRWVLDADIEACFDNVSHSAVMDRVRRRVKDKRVLALVKAFLKAGVLTELGENQDTHTGTPQGGILSPLLFNIALSVLDEHLHGPWKPGGTMATDQPTRAPTPQGAAELADRPLRRRFRRPGARHRAGRRGPARRDRRRARHRWGCGCPQAKTQIVHMSEGFDFLGFRIQWRRKRGTNKWHVYTFIADRPIRSVKAKIRALTRRTSQQDLGTVLTRLNQVMRGWANYFRHAVAKHTFNMLDNFAWWRVIRMLRARHHWRWTDVRRRFTTPTGRWLPITADGIELLRIAAIPVTRYRYRGNTIPNPWVLPTTPNGRHRGEPVALRAARRVRREAWGNGPGAIPAPRPRPTQRQLIFTELAVGRVG